MPDKQEAFPIHVIAFLCQFLSQCTKLGILIYNWVWLKYRYEKAYTTH